MTNWKNFLFGVLPIILLLTFLYLLFEAPKEFSKKSKSDVVKIDDIISSKLITIEIDGEKYLYGKIEGSTVLTPKIKCSCEK
jgi:hypothetical protein